MTTESRTLVFDDPRLHMTVAGRIFVRIARSAAGLLTIAAAATFLLSDAPQLFWAGVFLCLVIADGIFHSGEGERTLEVLPKSGTVNVASALDRRAFRILEDAFDRSVILRRDACLQAAIQLAHASGGQELLRRLDIMPEEFKQKTEEIRDSEMGRALCHDHLADVRTLAVRAAESALRNGARFVEPIHLFATVLRGEHPLTARLIEAFALADGEVEQALGLTRLPVFRSGDAPQGVVRAYRVLATPAVAENGVVDGDGGGSHDNKQP